MAAPTDRTILSVKPRFGKANGPNRTMEGSRVTRVWNDEYVVIAGLAATGDDGLDAVDLGLPDDLSAHPQDTGALVTSRVPDDQGGGVWYVAVTWDSNHGDPRERNEKPTDDPIKWRWGGRWVMETPLKDLDGEPFVDAAGVPFSPPPEFRIPRLTLTITKNLADYDSLVMRTYMNTYSTLEFFGHPAKTGLMGFITADEAYADGESYWKVTFPIEFKGPDEHPDTWEKAHILNQGPKYIGSDDEGIIEIHKLMDDDNHVLTGDVGLLDDVGRKLDKFRRPIFREFRVTRAKDWTLLGIDIPSQAPIP